jgi:hypothetical protein
MKLGTGNEKSLQKMDLKEVGLGRDMDWIDLAQDWDRWRVLLNGVINFRVP